MQNKETELRLGHKRTILRKLMIAQRNKFLAKKEQAEVQRMKQKLAETSLSNFSQTEEEEASEKKAFSESQADNIRLLYDVWDTARIVDTEETYEQRVHFFHLSLQILKVATYVVLSLVVLGCAVLSKGSLLLMTNAIGHVETVTSYRTVTSSTRH